VDRLDAAVVAEARRSHPFILEDGAHRDGAQLDSDEGMPLRLDGPLPEPGADAVRYPFAGGDLSAVRRVVSAQATDAGLAPPRAAMLVLAVNELVTNSLQHGGGRGELLLWQEGPDVVAEVRDRGHLRDLLVGRSTPDQRQGHGRGVWLVNQICDLVQLRSGPGRTVVRVRIGPR
jgi:anti-sigma regulatory factor (Ser/Thr protein kinase)